MRRPILLFLVLVVLALPAAAALWCWQEFHGPGPSEQPVLVVMPRGEGLRALAERLNAAGVLRHPPVLAAGALASGAARSLRAGEYLFPARVSPAEVLAMLRQGRIHVRRFTLAEGLTSAEAMMLIAAAEGLAGEMPPPPPEGSLLPQTYHYSWGDSRGALVERMRASMQDTLRELWDGRQPDLPLASPDEAVILASIVEKETAVAAERPRVAGVFVNRLRRGMRLQSDPTVVYGLTLGKAPLGRELSRADLETDHPFNTYRIHGLPPRPIANPGRESLAAVLHPAATRDLYFVADGKGGHAFAETLDGHNRNVRRWRELRRGLPAAP